MRFNLAPFNRPPPNDEHVFVDSYQAHGERVAANSVAELIHGINTKQEHRNSVVGSLGFAININTKTEHREKLRATPVEVESWLNIAVKHSNKLSGTVHLDFFIRRFSIMRFNVTPFNGEVGAVEFTFIDNRQTHNGQVTGKAFAGSLHNVNNRQEHRNSVVAPLNQFSLNINTENVHTEKLKGVQIAVERWLNTQTNHNNKIATSLRVDVIRRFSTMRFNVTPFNGEVGAVEFTYICSRQVYDGRVKGSTVAGSINNLNNRQKYHGKLSFNPLELRATIDTESKYSENLKALQIAVGVGLNTSISHDNKLKVFARADIIRRFSVMRFNVTPFNGGATSDIAFVDRRATHNNRTVMIQATPIVFERLTAFNGQLKATTAAGAITNIVTPQKHVNALKIKPLELQQFINRKAASKNSLKNNIGYPHLAINRTHRIDNGLAGKLVHFHKWLNTELLHGNIVNLETANAQLLVQRPFISTNGLKSRLVEVEKWLNRKIIVDNRLKIAPIDTTLYFNAIHDGINKLKNESHLGAFFSVETTHAENIGNTTHGGLLFSVRHQQTNSLANKTIGGKLINRRHFVNGVLNNIVIIGSREYQSAFIDVTIPPGWELRINSDNKTVILVMPPTDTSSVRHLYSGNWIFFNRNVERLILTAGGENVQGQVIYNDWWL